MIPNRITKERRATKGEVRTFEALARGLDKSWYVWYDVGIGNKEVYPDFILIHPLHGLLVLEVKDYRISDLIRIDKEQFETRFRRDQNPLRKVRYYTFEVINIKKVATAPPYEYAVIFPNIAQDDLQKSIEGVTINDLIERNRIFCQEDIVKSNIAESVMRLVDIGGRQKKMTANTFNQLRVAIDPSLKVPFRYHKPNQSGEIVSAVLDIKQERVAKSIGEGHRLLRGIAGSGKTLIMLYRAKLIGRLNPKWKVLFICWNRSLINYLEQMSAAINMHGQDGQVEFVYFSEWVKSIANLNGIKMPIVGGGSPEQKQAYDRSYSEVIRKLLDLNPTLKYQAILIDEGQDFDDDYYRLLLKYLDSATDSLLICYDYAQNLYQRKTSWRKLGVSARGARTISLGSVDDQLIRNYRNSYEITAFSKYLYNDRIPDMDEKDKVGYISRIQGKYEHGSIPFLYLSEDRQDEYTKIVNWVNEILNAHNLSQKDFLIIYPGKRVRDFNVEWGLIPQLNKAGHETTWISENHITKSRFNVESDSIKISTIGSAKGMDFEACAVVACDCINSEKPEVDLYISATRARKHLLFTTGGRNHTVTNILESSHSNLVDHLEENHINDSVG